MTHQYIHSIISFDNEKQIILAKEIFLPVVFA